MSKKHDSLSIKTRAEVQVVDVNEIAQKIVETVLEHRRVIDPTVVELIPCEQQLVADILADEFNADFIYNQTNSIFGLGILTGLVMEAIQNYYHQLELAEQGEIEEPVFSRFSDEDLN